MTKRFSTSKAKMNRLTRLLLFILTILTLTLAKILLFHRFGITSQFVYSSGSNGDQSAWVKTNTLFRPFFMKFSYSFVVNMNADYFPPPKAVSKPRHRQKSDLVGLRECPYRLPADTWCDNPVQWPEIEYPDNYNYLINTPSKFERATQVLIFLFGFSDLFLKRLIEELHIIITKIFDILYLSSVKLLVFGCFEG